MSDKTIKRTIRVLQEDIDQGQRFVPYACMVARAAAHDLDFLEQGWSVDVDYLSGGRRGGRIKVLDATGEVRFRASLDAETAAKIVSWDNETQPIEPFAIEASFGAPRKR